MVECIITENSGFTWLRVEGRIDSMTASEVEHRINEIMGSGKHLMVADLEGVNFVSSAGLRVFLKAQKELKPVGGEIVFYGLSDPILRVFEMSGFCQVFSIASSLEDIQAIIHLEKPSGTEEREIGPLLFHCDFRQATQGTLKVFGSQEKLAGASYSQEDVQTVKASEFSFGVGLATLGDQYEGYKDLFGEAVVINRNLFYYPAVKRPVVDFNLCGSDAESFDYRFLTGFGFSGSYHCLLSFESASGPIELKDLISGIFQLSDANLLGLVIMAESKGVWGMHLKKAPILENRPKNNETIFSSGNFQEWMNFPVEPTDFNSLVVGCGIAVREKPAKSPRMQSLLAQESNFHIHAGVFAKEPLSRKTDLFESELSRITTEGTIHKVQHLLGKTRFATGMAAIIELTA